MKTFLLYILSSPGGEIRYVGQTTKSLAERLKTHLKPSSLIRKCHKSSWLKSLVDQGEIPDITLLQSFYNHVDLDEAEIYWIRELRERGFRLVNDATGGKGAKNLSPEARAKIGEALKGRRASLETRARMRAAHKGKIHGPGTREKLSAYRKGRLHSPETRVKMSISQRLRQASKGIA
jgi:hypothetical protein